MKSIEECYLYAFIDIGYLRGRSVGQLTLDLCQGGADIVQLRAKTLYKQEVVGLALEILPITKRFGVPFVVNDFPEVAQELGAEYLHLGQEDFFDSGHHEVSEVKGARSSLKVGLSSHSPEQGLRAVEAGADYVAVGPVFPTGTKPNRPAVTLDYVRWAAANLKLPWFAIGGINLNNLTDILDAGAKRVCIVSSILNHNDVAGACAEFKRRLVERC